MKTNSILSTVTFILCVFSLRSEHLIGPSFIDLDVHYARTMLELKELIQGYSWGQECINVCKNIADNTHNGVIHPALSNAMDLFACFKGQHQNLEGDIKDAVNRMESAILSRVSHAFLYTLSNNIETIIDRLEKEKLYWLWCKEHPWKHFFSKSPLVWFEDQSQEHQVAERLSAIQQLLDNLFEQYGRLVRHNATFQECIDAKQRYEWAEKTIELISSVVVYEMPLFAKENSFAQLVYRLNSLVDLCDRYVKTLQHRLRCVQRPHHMARYWIPYTATAAGILTTWWHYSNNQQEVNSFINEKICNEYPTLIKKNINETFSKRFKDFLDLLLDRNRPEKPDFNIARREVEEGAQKLINGLEIIKQNTMDLSHKHENLGDKIASLKEMEIPSVDASTWVGTATFSNYQDTAKEFVSVFADVGTFAADSIKNVNVLIADLMEQIKEGVHIAKNLSDDTVDKAEFYADQTDELLNKKLSLTIGMLAMLPATAIAGGTTWTGYKMVKSIKRWLTKQDFGLIRSRLSGIHDVLIAAGSMMSNQHYGRFMYCLHKLHLQAYKNVPYHERDAFIAHLKQLAADTLNVDQKKETIANMRATYEFLSPLFIV